MGQTKSRFRQFADEQWERIEPLLPSNEGWQGHPLLDNRKVVEGIIYSYRAGIPWRDLPRVEFGAWQAISATELHRSMGHFSLIALARRRMNVIWAIFRDNTTYTEPIRRLSITA